MKSLIGWAHALRLAGALTLASSATVGAQKSVRDNGPGTAITVIVVRHAEKTVTPAEDPPLSAAGEARARDLVDVLRDARVSAIVTTQFARTRATAQPTALATGVTPQVVPTTSPTHARDVAAAVRKHPGETVLVVGHSNTVPAIVEALGAKRPADICDGEFDNLYIVTIAADGTAGVVRSKYGARTPVDAHCAVMR